jgi:hypothetical protein
MKTALLRDSTNCAPASADSVDARVATSDCCVITTNTLTISSCKTPGCSFTLPTIPTLRGKIGFLLLRFFTRAPEHAAKSP